MTIQLPQGSHRSFLTTHKPTSGPLPANSYNPGSVLPDLGSERLMLDSAAPVSAIFFPGEGQRIPAGNIVVKGYAVADFVREIERVELSLDGGRTWLETELSDNPRPGEWRLWRKLVNLAPRQYELVVRAIDTMANKGPSDVDLTWHLVSFEVIP
jgi:sulfite oxidase